MKKKTSHFKTTINSNPHPHQLREMHVSNNSIPLIYSKQFQLIYPYIIDPYNFILENQFFFFTQSRNLQKTHSFNSKIECHRLN